MPVLGTMRYQAIRPARRTREMTKSASVDTTAAIGMMRRGKYTFVSRLELPTRLFDDPDTAAANNCHGRSAASVNTGYGTPSEGRLARRLNTIVKMITVT